MNTACITPAIDWAAAELAASTLGPRTRGLVGARNLDGLALWLPLAVESSRGRAPALAGLYEQLAELVGVARSFASGDVDRHGDAA